MARTATIKLDDKEYTVHALNVNELQEVFEIIGNGNTSNISGLKVLSIAVRRAEPPIEDFGLLEPTTEELNEAGTTILKLSGIEIQNPPATAPVAG